MIERVCLGVNGLENEDDQGDEGDFIPLADPQFAVICTLQQRRYLCVRVILGSCRVGNISRSHTVTIDDVPFLVPSNNPSVSQKWCGFGTGTRRLPELFLVSLSIRERSEQEGSNQIGSE